MSEKRTFIFSSETFSNFSTSISLFHVESLDDIINTFKSILIDILKKNNFTNLINKLNKSELHIHSYTIEDILTSNEDLIFYICDHC